MINATLPSGKQVQAFPLSFPQQFMFYMSSLYGASFPVNNIGMAYFIHGSTNEEKMIEAVKEAVSRCDTMRLRFIPDEKYKILQYVSEEADTRVEVIDLSNMSFEEGKKYLQSISRKEIPTFNREIHKTAVLRMADGVTGLYFLLHHFAMDAFSASVFLKDVLDIYLHKTEGRQYPKPMRPYLPVLKEELSYMSSEDRERDKEYWYSSLAAAPEPIFTDYMLDNRLYEQQKTCPGQRFANIHSGSPEADTLIFSLDKKSSDMITEACTLNNLSVCAFLSMGVRTALSVFNNNEKDVSFKMIVNRRGSIAEKKSGGIRINYFPMRSIIDPEISFREAVEKISCIQNEIYSHCSLSFSEMLAQRHKSMPSEALPDSTYDSLGFSYQPLLQLPAIKDFLCESKWFNNGASMIPLYLTVKHRTSDNGFDFIFEYRKQPDPEQDLRIFYEKLKNSLLSGAMNINISVGEILEKEKLTQDERNITHGQIH